MSIHRNGLVMANIMKNHLVSIVVPIHNVIAYLEDAVESAVGQSYKNIEIVLVDDGSNDFCSTVCDQYALSDNRTIVIHKNHDGPSGARNCGIDVCSGDYLAFLDSDDYYSLSMIEKLVEQISRYNVDIVVCNIHEVDEIGRNARQLYAPLQNNIYSKKEALLELIGKNERTHTVVWNKLYSRHLWNTVKFPVGKIHEDTFVMHWVFDNASTVVTIEDALYYHRIRKGSIMTTRRANSYACSIEAMIDFLDFWVQKHNDIGIRKMDLQCFEAIRTSYWNGYYRNREVQNAVKYYKEKYKSLHCRDSFTRFRLFLFWICPPVERVINYFHRTF